MTDIFNYGTDHLTIGICLDIAAGKTKGIINKEAADMIKSSWREVEKIVHSHHPVYGINTGFGPLCDTRISEEDTSLLQSNILKSHSVGVGKPIPQEIAKLMMITKVQALAQGYSGIALATLERIIWHIDNDIIPVVPEKGSVGASGDLAPLSHLFLPLIGLGEVFENGGRIPAGELLKRHGLQPLLLGPKEGLALINGTQFILAFAVKAVQRLDDTLNRADLIGAMSLEGLMGSIRPFDERLHQIRPFKGTRMVAHRLFTLLDGSEINSSHISCDRIQDPYSLRCMPQVHGASRNAWLHLKELTEIELNSVTDNPVIFNADDTISGGNFHGQPLALPLDYATTAAAEIGNIADRRCYLMSEGRYGLPKLLTHDAGLNSGLMIPQYTTAALVTENKTLCFPASADSVPTSLGQEDHVSMGSISGRKLHQVIDNIEYIQAIELLYAAQAMDFRRPLKSTPVIEACHQLVRQHVAFIQDDRVFAVDINSLHKLITDGSLLKTAGEAAIAHQIDLSHDEFGIY
ncbi:histidine ammonia-lyase [Mucilaginibacter rubeus]|uniref:Histidine ammonia-lyase n=1 Tax=Mucilaginibacter rubeus TaxID=2027860 RepID=A0AAE6JLB2_9SPHI|nr:MULTISPECIES: histidine ammonia-lyase [Mucilaginibacter]QEM07766.1 histidine ammonia-lyase [Mucilaginibacter rubeus]QEM20219.1 histidine ammonia-lyase [Mucilaginibacter gossypii]QTE43064.1 histidine ammonia-lyase [Mucilaginibacter rubeus]QTE49665.1 histidine ammonia-lyase [Mucilaginibacter rubeus]QTE54760.1 histidine ammonia-lyase [Mucilaginibacter rubeus]